MSTRLSKKIIGRYTFNIGIAIFGLLLLGASRTPDAISTKPDNNLHLYLLIGQSNMAGRGALDDSSKIINQNILMLTKDNTWTKAVDPLHFDRPAVVGVGPGLSFAREMLELYGEKEIKIGLIPCAVGGSGIDSWQVGKKFIEDYPYDDAIRRAKKAQERGVIKGILWHQGESDTNEKRKAMYIERLIKLVQNLRQDLQAPNLPFVAGELGYYKENFKSFNTVFNQLEQQIPHSTFVKANNLNHNGDGVHMDTPSARKLGLRYAHAMYGLQNSIK